MHSDKTKFHILQFFLYVKEFPITSRSGISDKLIYIYHLPVKPLPNFTSQKKRAPCCTRPLFWWWYQHPRCRNCNCSTPSWALISSNPLSVSENSGTPKSSILIGFSIINHPFWGTPIFWKHPPIEREDQFGDTEHGYLPPEPPLLLPCIDTSPKPDSRTGGSMMPRAGFLCQGTGLNQLVLCWDPCVNLTSVRNDVHLLWSEVKLQDYWWFKRSLLLGLSEETPSAALPPCSDWGYQLCTYLKGSLGYTQLMTETFKDKSWWKRQ